MSGLVRKPPLQRDLREEKRERRWGGLRGDGKVERRKEKTDCWRFSSCMDITTPTVADHFQLRIVFWIFCTKYLTFWAGASWITVFHRLGRTETRVVISGHSSRRGPAEPLGRGRSQVCCSDCQPYPFRAVPGRLRYQWPLERCVRWVLVEEVRRHGSVLGW